MCEGARLHNTAPRIGWSGPGRWACTPCAANGAYRAKQGTNPNASDAKLQRATAHTVVWVLSRCAQPQATDWPCRLTSTEVFSS